MKKLLAVLLTLTLTLSAVSCAFAAMDVAGSLKKLSDEDLRVLQYYLTLELKSRGLSTDSSASAAGTGTGTDVLVYITEHGSKYHSSVRCGSAVCTRSLTVAEALAEGYSPCGRCNPPTK